MTAMREVVDGVFEVRIGFVNVHLVVVDDGVVLVDTGLPGKAPKVEQALHNAGKTVGEVHTILLTHRHDDHTGAAAELRRRSGARTVAHQADVPVISGAEQATLTRLQKLAGMVTGRAEPVVVDEVITTDGPCSLPGFQAFHTPGHTAGHVSYLLDRADGVLFAGDAAGAGLGGRVSRGPRMMMADPAAAHASLARLAALDFDVAVFGHGQAVTGGAVDRFRELVTR
jgi:glyoxylase-like metal-dependent hydrolase (beta-lactamase superfamily II)